MKSPAKLTGGKQFRYESDLQKMVCNYLKSKYRNIPYYAIPNGGKMNRITGAIRKATGTIAGMPDLCIATPRDGFGALYLELKNGTSNNTTKDQKLQIKRLQDAGNAVVVCRSFDEAQHAIDTYLREVKP